jgi:acyl carrier protein
MTPQQIELQVRDFVIGQFLFDVEHKNLANNVSFLDTGIVDSTGILELVAYLEDNYGVTIEDEELVPENLDSVNNIVAFVSRKLEAPAKDRTPENG